ncbi:MAG: permease [Acidaminobacteraceae bacterium]
MVSILKKNKMLVFAFFVYASLLIYSPAKFTQSLGNTSYYLKEMIEILPVVFLLTALIEAWVPKETIMNSFGENAGAKGILFSFLLGSFSAGPIYAAFPVCKMLLKKGASIYNVVIILSAWAVIKVPMLANEAKFLGLDFMATRWILTTVSILFLAYMVKLVVAKEDILSHDENSNGFLIYNEKYCVGCQICSKLEPQVFYMDGSKAGLIENVDYTQFKSSLVLIEEKCPGNAIIINH